MRLIPPHNGIYVLFGFKIFDFVFIIIVSFNIDDIL